MGATAMIVGAAAGMIGTAHSIEQSNHQKRLAGQAADRQRFAMEAQERDLAESKRKDQLVKTRDEQRRKQQAARLAAQGRDSTILTGPGGVAGAPGQGSNSLGGGTGKTLLGA